MDSGIEESDNFLKNTLILKKKLGVIHNLVYEILFNP